MNVLPSHLTNMALIIRGNIRAGIFEEVTLPTFQRKMETRHLPGTSHPIEIDYGPEGAMEISLSSSELEPLILQDYGVCNSRPARIHLKSAFKQPVNCQLDKHEVIAKGIWKQIELGSQKMKEQVNRKYVLSCHEFRYLVNGKELININALAPDEQERQLLGL